MEKADIIKKLEKSNSAEDKKKMLDLLFMNSFHATTFKMSNFYEIIKELRLFYGITQEEFSKILEIDRTSLSRYENGERTLPLLVIDKIMEIFGLSINVYPISGLVELLQSNYVNTNTEEVRKYFEKISKEIEKDQ
ncbi:MAG: helix-turn-helix domain-containing protein [Ignavibacteriales bacterium]